ncbi:hypothetical protein ACS0TY_017040 [Phlomoides rotata]
MVCLQESKREIVNSVFCESLWPDNDFGWVYSGARGAVGGIIMMWRRSAFTVRDQWSTDGALAIKGLWIEEKISLILINISNQTEVLCCLCGDFNTTLEPDERKGVGRYNDAKKRRQFNRFVSDNDLVDLPLLRRRYTWYKDNGGRCSRIDRFLISAGWCKRWPNAKQIGLKRTISDHAPILLDVNEKEYWGPVPFKMVKNGTIFSREIEEIEKQLSSLDEKQENEEWEEADTHSRRSLQLELEELRLKRDRLFAQKSRAKWLTDGDANTSFFQSLINRNNKRSELKNVKINEDWCEGVNQVQEGIYHYFKKFFSDERRWKLEIRGI